MKKIIMFSMLTVAQAQAGSPVCMPNASTAFLDNQDQAFTISNDALGNNRLYRQCSNMSNQQFISDLDGCGPLTHPINGLGLNPADNFLYGFMPTDALGIGTHLELTIPFPAPGKPGDMMKADPVDVYRLGNDGGYQRIGTVAPPDEDPVLPADTDQVIPIVHNAASFDATGNLFLLGYKTNYQSSADVMAGTGEVDYQTPQIMIGQVSSAALTAASGGVITAVWSQADTTTDPVCAAVMNRFRDRTNAFSDCMVTAYIANGDEDAALQACLPSTEVLDFGVHDFAVSPVNGNYYALDSMTYDDRDVLIEVNAGTMQASCTEYTDLNNDTGVLTSLMFSRQNKLVAVFANENMANWIDVSTGDLTSLTDLIDPYPFGDGSSMPFVTPIVPGRSGIAELIFYNGFEDDLIFANDFEGVVQPPACPAF